MKCTKNVLVPIYKTNGPVDLFKTQDVTFSSPRFDEQHVLLWAKRGKDSTVPMVATSCLLESTIRNPTLIVVVGDINEHCVRTKAREPYSTRRLSSFTDVVLLLDSKDCCVWRYHRMYSHVLPPTNVHHSSQNSQTRRHNSKRNIWTYQSLNCIV